MKRFNAENFKKTFFDMVVYRDKWVETDDDYFYDNYNNADIQLSRIVTKALLDHEIEYFASFKRDSFKKETMLRVIRNDKDDGLKHEELISFFIPDDFVLSVATNTLSSDSTELITDIVHSLFLVKEVG